MNDACYTVVFSQAVEAFIDYIGMDANYRKKTGITLYTLEMHLCYIKDVHEGEALQILTQLLDADRKRLHLFLSMQHDPDESLLATSEQTLLCIDTRGPHATTFSADVLERIEAIRGAHRHLRLPKQVGRSVGLKPRSGS